MPRIRSLVFVAALLAAEVGAVVALHRIGRVSGFGFPREPIGQWIAHAQTEDLVVVCACGAGLLLAWWLLIATLLSLARRVVPGWRRLRALDAITPIAVRRLVDRTVAIGLGASFAFAGVHPVGAATTTSRPRADVPVVRSAPSPSRPAPVVVRPAPRRAVPAFPTVVVLPGDNLWVIARRAVERTSGPAGPLEIAPYWRLVIAANAGTLRSHDPNLIFPGERIVLPPPAG